MRSVLLLFIVTGYAFKVTAALLDTPLVYVAAAVLKKYLRLDPTKVHDADEEEIAGR